MGSQSAVQEWVRIGFVVPVPSSICDYVYYDCIHFLYVGGTNVFSEAYAPNPLLFYYKIPNKANIINNIFIYYKIRRGFGGTISSPYI